MGLSIILWLQTGLPPEVEKARETLAQKPDNQQANLIVGKYHLQQGEVEKAVPFLLKGSDNTLKSIAKTEEGASGKTGAKLVALGDEWLKVTAKGPLRQVCVDRASHWFGQAWPDLDAGGRAKLMQRLSALYAGPRGTPERIGNPNGWSGIADVVSETVHTGRYSVRFLARPSRVAPAIRARAVFDSPSFPAQKGQEYVLSFWVLADGNDTAEDRLTLDLVAENRGIIAKAMCLLPQDRPAWTRLTASVTAPEDTTAGLRLTLYSMKGKIYLDDVSVKSGGKELIVNGGFEE